MTRNGVIHSGGIEVANSPYVRPLLDETQKWLEEHVVPQVDPTSVSRSPTPDCSGLVVEPAMYESGVSVTVHPEGRRCPSRWGQRFMKGVLVSAGVKETDGLLGRVQRSLEIGVGMTVGSNDQNGALHGRTVFTERLAGEYEGVRCIDEVSRQQEYIITSLGELVGVIDTIKQVAGGRLGIEDGYQQLFGAQQHLSTPSVALSQVNR